MQLSQSSAYFVRWWGPEGPPNEGPKGPPMPSAGARRKGPEGPELLVNNITLKIPTGTVMELI